MFAGASKNLKPLGATALAMLLAAFVLTIAPPAAADDTLVTVNERPISRKVVTDMLMETHGLRIMQQLIVLELAKQETRRRGIEVTSADVQAQFHKALDEIAPDRSASGAPLSEAEKIKALEKVLTDKCLTMPEFMVAMERNAHLRKVVESSFEVDDATLREEFARTHGEKVQIRHIAIRANDTHTLHEAVDRLSRNEDFAQVARQISANAETAAQGGLMEPFAFNDESVPAAGAGRWRSRWPPARSPARRCVGEMIHILKLERRVPPEDVQFEDVPRGG